MIMNMKDTASGENIFTRINTRRLRERAFEHLAQNFSEATVRIKGGGSYRVKVLARTGRQISAESLQAKFAEHGLVQVIFSFDVGPEKYFMQSSANITSEKFLDISLMSDLFKLQRRQNFRVDLRDNYESQVKLEAVDEQTCAATLATNDLSLGGLSFDLEDSLGIAIEKSQLLKAHFHMPEKDLQFPFQARVCYVQKLGSMGSGIQRIGVEFEPLDSKIENQMLEVLIEIQRQGIG